MGAGQSSESSGPTIRVLNSATAAQRLAQQNGSGGDKYFYGCISCAANRAAMQAVEPVGAPVGAEEQLNAIKLPTWAPKELEVAFFREGLPHTRGSRMATIWLPLNALQMPNFAQTFLHECVHISQRLQPDIWTKIYKAAFNAEPAESDLPPELNGRLRLNPDTYGWPHFTYWGRWTPVLIFKRPEVARLDQVRLLFLNKAGGWQSAPPADWMEKIGTDVPVVCEHPNELSAYLIADPDLSALPICQKLLGLLSRYIG
jgi:hypothetical protein